MNKIEICFGRGYFVCMEGVPYNKHGVKVGFVSTSGYYSIKIRINKKCTTIPVHRLQAFQKYGKNVFKENMVVRHLDSNPLNNSWNNIALGTQGDNMMDIPKQVRISRAIKASSCLKKYNNEDVIKFYKNTKSYKKTMENFNIRSKGTLHYILNK